MSESPDVNTQRRKELFELVYNDLFTMAGRHEGSSQLTRKGRKQEVNNIPQGPVPSSYFLQLDSASQSFYSLQKAFPPSQDQASKQEPMGDISFQVHNPPTKNCSRRFVCLVLGDSFSYVVYSALPKEDEFPTLLAVDVDVNVLVCFSGS